MTHFNVKWYGCNWKCLKRSLQGTVKPHLMWKLINNKVISIQKQHKASFMWTCDTPGLFIYQLLANCPNYFFNFGSVWVAFNRPFADKCWGQSCSIISWVTLFMWEPQTMWEKLWWIHTREKIRVNKMQEVTAHILCFLQGFAWTWINCFCWCTLLLYLLPAVSISPVCMCVLNIYSIDSHSWHCSAWENTPLFLCVVFHRVSIQSCGVCACVRLWVYVWEYSMFVCVWSVVTVSFWVKLLKSELKE